MVMARPEDLKNAYGKERDLQVKIMMAAVNMVYMNNESTLHTADSLMQCPHWVSMWVERFGEGRNITSPQSPAWIAVPQHD